jgi:hypothetical protein
VILDDIFIMCYLESSPLNKRDSLFHYYNKSKDLHNRVLGNQKSEFLLKLAQENDSRVTNSKCSIRKGSNVVAMRRIGMDTQSEIKTDEVIIQDPLVKFIEGDIAAQKKKNSLNIISHTNESYSLKSTTRKREDSYNEQREHLDEIVHR